MNFSTWFAQLDFSKWIEMLIVAGAAMICVTFHEVSHGYAAYLLGDPTAKRAGRLSLNPIKHMDIMGLVCMAIAHFGWAKPVPINPGYFKHYRRDTAITALAGPAANVLLAAVFLMLSSAVRWMGYYWGWNTVGFYLDYFCWYGAILSAGLAVFNIFPIPPLDGSKVLFSFLPQRSYSWLLRYERYGFLIMVVLIYAGVLDKPLMFLRNGLLDILIPVCQWPAMLLQTLFG